MRRSASRSYRRASKGGRKTRRAASGGRKTRRTRTGGRRARKMRGGETDYTTLIEDSGRLPNA